jgi:hypothetical protein
LCCVSAGPFHEGPDPDRRRRRVRDRSPRSTRGYHQHQSHARRNHHRHHHHNHHRARGRGLHLFPFSAEFEPFRQHTLLNIFHIIQRRFSISWKGNVCQAMVRGHRVRARARGQRAAPSARHRGRPPAASRTGPERHGLKFDHCLAQRYILIWDIQQVAGVSLAVPKAAHVVLKSGRAPAPYCVAALSSGRRSCRVFAPAANASVSLSELSQQCWAARAGPLTPFLQRTCLTQQGMTTSSDRM